MEQRRCIEPEISAFTLRSVCVWIQNSGQGGEWAAWQGVMKKRVGSKGNMDESKRNRGLDSGSKVGQVGLV